VYYYYYFFSFLIIIIIIIIIIIMHELFYIIENNVFHLVFFAIKFVTHYQYKLESCWKTKCCKQCRYMYVKSKGTMTKWPVQKNNTQNNTKTRRTPRRNRQLERKLFLCFSTEPVFIWYLHYRFVLLTQRSAYFISSLTDTAKYIYPMIPAFYGCFYKFS